MTKIYYIANARIPTDKAYGIQLAKMCEAFIEQGADLELLIPRTQRAQISLKEFYHLRVDIPTKLFASLDWYDKGRIGFALSSLSFMTAVFFYLLKRDRSAVVYTIDMDSYSFSPLAFLRNSLFAEMHSPKTSNVLTRFFFRRVDGVITTNPVIKQEIERVFGLPTERFIVEPNGVDPLAFSVPSKNEARQALGLSISAPIVLYVGRFYDWKGMDILQSTAAELEQKGIFFYLVGGTQKEFEERTKSHSKPLRFGGSVRHEDIARWCAAADLLLILGTRANEFSYRYTAPMKLYEYLATGRPVIAADTEALRSLVSEQEVTFYSADDPKDLANQIDTLVSNTESTKQKSMRGIEKAREHEWSMRARRILSFCTNTHESRS